MKDRFFITSSASCRWFLEEVGNQLTVCSPYGILEKEAMAPCGPGDEEYLTLEFSRISELSDELRQGKAWVGELEGCLVRLSSVDTLLAAVVRGDILTPLEVTAVSEAIVLLREIRHLVQEAPPSIGPLLAPKLSDSLASLIEVAGQIYPDGTPYLKSRTGNQYREKLVELHDVLMNLRGENRTGIESLEESTGLTVDGLGSLKVSYLDETLVSYLDGSPLVDRQKQIGEYIFFSLRPSPQWHQLKRQAKDLRFAVTSLGETCRREFSECLKKVRPEMGRLLSGLGHLDLLLSKSRYGRSLGGRCPEISLKPVLDMVGGRYPGVPQDSRVYGNLLFNCRFTQGVSVISGGYESSRDVLLETIARILYLIHCGIPVPVENLTTGLFNFIIYTCGRDLTGENELKDNSVELYKASIRNGRGLFLLDDPSEVFPAGISAAVDLALMESIRTFPGLVLLVTRDSTTMSYYQDEALYIVRPDSGFFVNGRSVRRLKSVPWESGLSDLLLVQVMLDGPFGKEISKNLKKIVSPGKSLTEAGQDTGS